MLIAFAGLPSSGKSSTAKALGTLMGAEAFLEPEECDWPDLVTGRSTTGAFTALTWFRGVRVPQLFQADALRRNKCTAIVDSYYDVLISGYLGTPSFEWLLSRNDPYFGAAEAMAQADWVNLPKADVLVFLHLNEQTWINFMNKRDRNFDRSAGLIQHFAMQGKMESVCREAAAKHDTKLVILEQRPATPEATARRVVDAIRCNS